MKEKGYLSLDRQLRILPFAESDDNVLKYPIVGIWVSGVELKDTGYNSK